MGGAESALCCVTDKGPSPTRKKQQKEQSRGVFQERCFPVRPSVCHLPTHIENPGSGSNTTPRDAAGTTNFAVGSQYGEKQAVAVQRNFLAPTVVTVTPPHTNGQGLGIPELGNGHAGELIEQNGSAHSSPARTRYDSVAGSSTWSAPILRASC
mmetsp:Transcript_24641/g.39710  ORF Transcript_24641/g.39710 Transcript_24641/m.39710 type:complete len:154 (-) Transcript_24641:587-1048(-)